MQKLIRMSLVVVLLLATTGIVSAQYTIKGTQTKGSVGHNAKLDCDGVYVKKTVKIKSVSGDNAGFWIVDDNGKSYNFWNSNDKSAIGLVLKPGKYYAYPMIRQKAQKGTVIIRLE